MNRDPAVSYYLDYGPPLNLHQFIIILFMILNGYKCWHSWDQLLDAAEESVFLVFRVYWLFKIVKYTKMQGQTEWRHAIKNLGSNISFVMLSLQYISVLKFCVF